MSAIGLQLDQVSKTFDSGLNAVDKVSLTVQPGEFISLVGPSGCGKSTLLRIISGLESSTKGRVTWTSAQPRLGFVFQEAHLLPWKTVFENVALPLRLSRETQAVIDLRVQQALAAVELTEFAQAYPAQLSGGMKMRVSLCRALVNDPQVLLLDEPFAALDEITRHKLDEDLRKLWFEKRMTVLFVTHSISEATFLSDRCIVFSSRPAHIRADLNIKLSLKRQNSVRLTSDFVTESKKISEALGAS